MLRKLLVVITLLWFSGCSTLPSTSAERQMNAQAEQSLTLARTLRDAGRYQAATRVYQTADSKGLLTPAEALEYASVASFVEQPVHVLQLYQNVEARFANEANIKPAEQYALCLGMARMHLKLMQLPEAETKFQCALHSQPDNLAALNGLGVTADLAGQTERAQAFFQNALAISPRNATVSNNLSLLYFSEGEYEKSIKLLQPFNQARYKPQQLNLALAYLLNGQQETARWLLQQHFQDDQVDAVFQRLTTVGDRIKNGEPVRQLLLEMSQTPMLLAGK